MREYTQIGGDEEDRTPDPLLARQVLSQLSYTPKFLLILRQDCLGIQPYSLRCLSLSKQKLLYSTVPVSGNFSQIVCFFRVPRTLVRKREKTYKMWKIWWA